MTRTIPPAAAFILLTALGASPAATRAQTLQEAVVSDVQGVAEKVVSLAQAIPQETYTWRPEEGVRSVGEVLMHITSANYRFPGIIGIRPPEGTPEAWVRGNAEGLTQEDAVEALNASFSYIYDVVRGIEDLDEPVRLFGRDTNVRGFLLTMTTHLHEHLGQLIAYARTNHVTPPWSGM